jgi:RNA polymerase-binding transcription factor DksA
MRKKKQVEEQVEFTNPSMTQDEIKQLTIFELRETIEKLRVEKLALVKQVKQNLIESYHDKINLITNDLTKFDSDIDELNRKRLNIREEQKSFLKDIEKRYNIAGKWGYCPETGEIKTND